MKALLEKLQQSRSVQKIRKYRHQKLLFARRQKSSSPRGTNEEHIFFWKVVSLATVGLFFFSLIPQFTLPSRGYDDIGYVKIDNPPGELYIFNDDGFLIKPERQTQVGDRSDVGGFVYHDVKADETLSSISEKYGVTTETITDNNSIPNPDVLQPGTRLKVPASDGLIHTVESGETLSGIASKYDVDIEKLIAQNEIQGDPPIIHAGNELIIPGAKKPEPVQPTTTIVQHTNTGTSSQAESQSVTVSYGRETGGTLLFPTGAGVVRTQGFHYGHYAVDLAKSSGTTIYAAEGGTVERAEYGWNGGYGNVIVINHGNGMKTLYAHLTKDGIYVEKGQQVTRGQSIGYMGTTGRSTGTHLHFEVIDNGVKKNPLNYF